MKTTALIIALASIACTADRPDNEIDEPGSDAGVEPDDTLETPIIEPTPASTPLDTVAIRGRTTGTRVVAETADGSVLVSVLPGGTFCIDASVAPSATTAMTIHAIGGDGRISEPVIVDVAHDPSASAPPNPTCSGVAEVECVEAEICGNDTDDDCDGLADACDSACNGCIDDIFEPNDTAVDVPIIAAGEYNLQLCPCRDDWLAFERGSFSRITATATFDETQHNINLRLYRAAPGGFGEGELVASSFSITGIESVDFQVDEPGLYYLRVYALSAGDVQNISYQLTVD